MIRIGSILILMTVGVAVGAPLAGCHPTAGASGGSAPGGSFLEGYVTAGDSALWPDRTVPVCWEAATADGATDAQRASVQMAVTEAYGQPALGFRFTGWEPCTASAGGVHVAVADQTPQVAAYGKWLDGVANGVTLNASFLAGGMAACQNGDLQPACIKTYALHEFGHVLGLRHEADRPDNDCPAQDQTGGLGEAGAFPVGPYDPSSVMNYCQIDQDLTAGTVATLSDGDIATLTAYYGETLAFPTADLGAGCVADQGAWNSVQACCQISAGWTPAGTVGYRACSLPAAQEQAAACSLAAGVWNSPRACCQGPLNQTMIPRWRSFLQVCQ
jgi:hypothetical protein